MSSDAVAIVVTIVIIAVVVMLFIAYCFNDLLQRLGKMLDKQKQEEPFEELEKGNKN